MTRNTGTWGGRDVDRARAFMALKLPCRCFTCPKIIGTKDAWVIHHIKPRGEYPELTWVESNWAIQCRTCSNKSGQSAVINKAKAEARAESTHKQAGHEPFLGVVPARGKRRHSPALSPEQPPTPVFQPESLVGCHWLEDLLDIPDDASWPRYMSPPHPQAIDSYGLQLEEWLREEQGIELRWWQKLATRRQLEYDERGELCWETVIDSESRRSGKSTRVAGLATWRMNNQELFGEVQTIIHTGSDMAICREIQRRTWRWAEEVAGWSVVRSNGKEQMETRYGDRWLVRSQTSVYGYDCSLGLVDEGWDVPSSVVDEGLEPALLERRMPQLVLTSTAHRRATSLMRRKIASALAGMGEDWSTLLMLWGAPADADIGDEAVWKAASPHWSEHRARLIRNKYERAMRGELDPEADDIDPVAGFCAQYLNIWPKPSDPKRATGEPIATADGWESLNGFSAVTAGAPVAVAMEAWFTDGCAAAAAYRLDDGRVAVSVQSFDDLASAAAWAGSQGAMYILAGKNLLEDPAVVAIGAQPVGSTSRQSVTEMKRFIDEGLIAHDGSELLAQQVTDVRVSAAPEGMRLVSKTRLDGLKSATWAISQARKGGGVPKIW